MTEVAAGRKRLAEATTRRALRQLRVSNDLQVTGLDSAQGQVAAIGHDGEDDPLVILADSRGGRRVITPEVAYHRDVTLRTRHHLDGAHDISCRATDVAL
ncbi:MAG TPA: hypothetical protein VIJ23_07085 [Mycobacterium sp.]